MPGNHKSKSDGWIEVRPADVPSGIDHCGNHKPKDQPNTYMSDLTMREGIYHDRPAPRKDKRERADTFSNARRHQRPRYRRTRLIARQAHVSLLRLLWYN